MKNIETLRHAVIASDPDRTFMTRDESGESYDILAQATEHEKSILIEAHANKSLMRRVIGQRALKRSLGALDVRRSSEFLDWVIKTPIRESEDRF